MVTKREQAGFTMVELVCAFVIVSVLALASVHTARGKAQSMQHAFHETLALRLCQAELEAARVRPEGLEVGERAFELLAEAASLPGVRGSRLVRQVAPRLVEVEVHVHWLPAGAERESVVTLCTRLISKEAD